MSSYCLSCLEPPRCTATAECLPTTRLRMIARVTSDWKDPHNGGTYSVLSKADGELNLQRVTGRSDQHSRLLPLQPPLMRYRHNKQARAHSLGELLERSSGPFCLLCFCGTKPGIEIKLQVPTAHQPAFVSRRADAGAC